MNLGDRPSNLHRRRPRERRFAQPLYVPMNFFALRAPLLPLDVYLGLRHNGTAALGLEDPHGCANPSPFSNEVVRAALAVGSLSLLDALESGQRAAAKDWKIDSKLRRYMIRMSTRPTPFGLFAGVALGNWGEHTDYELSVEAHRSRMRPDMAWLMQLVINLEANPDIRRRLRFKANPAALLRGGRIFLAERASRGETPTPPSVSIRATGVVCKALQAAQEYVSYETLVSQLLADTPGATEQKIEKLVDQLWEQTLLLTDLRPPLTLDSPASHVVAQLGKIPIAAGIRSGLEETLSAAAFWDAGSPTNRTKNYRQLTMMAAKILPFGRSPVRGRPRAWCDEARRQSRGRQGSRACS